MSKLDKMKEKYDGIPIPEELTIRVQQEILRSQKQIPANHQQYGCDGRRRMHSFHCSLKHESGICSGGGQASCDRRAGPGIDVPIL